MAFKIVGVNENSDFPPRVETRLGEKFATPDSLAGAVATAGEYTDIAVSSITPESIGALKAKVHLVFAMGQSNMEGRGQPTSLTLDPINPRIYQYGADTRELNNATEPLDMPGTSGTGIGPALQFSRHFVASLPDEDIVIIIPAAKGSSPLIGTINDAWQWGANSNNLSAKAVTQAHEAISAAETLFPEHDIVTSAYLWHQGEKDGDNAVSMSSYRSALSTLIDGFRNEFGNAPFIIGQMVPEGLSVGTRRAINEAHSRAAIEFNSVGFALGGAGQSDNIHYNGPGQRRLAREMYRQYTRVVGKLSSDTPVIPASGESPSLQNDWVIQGDELSLSNVGTDPITVTVEFKKPFGGIPHVIAQGHVDGAGRIVSAYTANATETQFSLRYVADRTGGRSQPIRWVAFGPRFEG